MFSFFITSNLQLPKFQNCDHPANKIDDGSLKAIIKWRHYPNSAPSSVYRTRGHFSFK